VVVTAVAGIGIIMTIVDHMAEMAVVTATTVEDRLMIVAAVGVAEITGIVMGEETVLNSLTLVGKSQIEKVATVVDSMVETVMAEAEVLREKEDVTTTGVPALQKTGQNLFPETKESKQSSSVPEDTNLRELILIAMRIYQWRPPEVMFRLLLKIFVT
jgi:hypothetical protein